MDKKTRYFTMSRTVNSKNKNERKSVVTTTLNFKWSNIVQKYDIGPYYLMIIRQLISEDAFAVVVDASLDKRF